VPGLEINIKLDLRKLVRMTWTELSWLGIGSHGQLS
jgi:hypothetical protein